jgi:hypothetical protein
MVGKQKCEKQAPINSHLNFICYFNTLFKNIEGVTLYKYNPFNMISSPPIDQRCTYKTIIELVINRKVRWCNQADSTLKASFINFTE